MFSWCSLYFAETTELMTAELFFKVRHLFIRLRNLSNPEKTILRHFWYECQVLTVTSTIFIVVCSIYCCVCDIYSCVCDEFNVFTNRRDVKCLLLFFSVFSFFFFFFFFFFFSRWSLVLKKTWSRNVKKNVVFFFFLFLWPYQCNV